jgi:hypothetical protein
MPKSLKSNLTSEQFGAEMGKGWKDAVEYVFDADVHVLIESKIKKKLNKDDAGDVDVSFQFKKATPLLSILPENCFFRPDIRHKNPSARYYLAELKRSCPLNNEKKHIKQFVNFYNALLEFLVLPVLEERDLAC